MYICMVLKDVLINFLSLAAAVDAYVSSSIDYFFSVYLSCAVWLGLTGRRVRDTERELG